jgi:hypothetical protein
MKANIYATDQEIGFIKSKLIVAFAKVAVISYRQLF